MCANNGLLLDCSCHSLHVYGRATTKEIQLGGYMIPKGVTLFLSLGGIHTSKHNYTDPDKFWPVSAANNIT
jgi:cytochrome P450